MGYGFVFPVCLRFLSSYSLSDTITPIVSLDSYMENFFTIVLLMGAAFELPLLAWLLGGHLPPFLKRKSKLQIENG